MDWNPSVQTLEELASTLYLFVFLTYLFLKLKAASRPLVHTELRGQNQPILTPINAD